MQADRQTLRTDSTSALGPDVALLPFVLSVCASGESEAVLLPSTSKHRGLEPFLLWVIHPNLLSAPLQGKWRL